MILVRGGCRYAATTRHQAGVRNKMQLRELKEESYTCSPYPKSLVLRFSEDEG